MALHHPVQPGLLPPRAPPVATRPTAERCAPSAAVPSRWDWQQPAAGDSQAPTRAPAWSRSVGVVQVIMACDFGGSNLQGQNRAREQASACVASAIQESTNTQNHEDYTNTIIENMFEYRINWKECKRLHAQED